MDLGSLFLGLALLLVVAFVVALPVIERKGRREMTMGETDRLIARREDVLTALRDLDFDHATGKISDEDYAPQRAVLVAEGTDVLKQLDSQGTRHRPKDDGIEGLVAARRRSKVAGAQDPIEAQIEARRQRKSASASACPSCATPVEAADRFCKKCGWTLRSSCPSCGTPASTQDRFCAKCGARLDSPSEDSKSVEVAG